LLASEVWFEAVAFLASLAAGASVCFGASGFLSSFFYSFGASLAGFSTFLTSGALGDSLGGLASISSLAEAFAATLTWTFGSAFLSDLEVF
jgi:hypothetical protein